MTKFHLSALLLLVVTLSACSPTSTEPVDLSTITNTIRTNLTKRVVDKRTDQEKQADRWLESLQLGDTNKQVRLQQVIATHLTEVRSFHNTKLGELTDPNDPRAPIPVEKQLAADATMPKSVHENLMAGLHSDLTGEQVEDILDKYTSGRIRPIFDAYHAIVPDLTKEEEAAILAILKETREEAVDYKNKEEIVAIFERGKVRCQEYLVSKGRDWNALFAAYNARLDAQKATDTNAPAAK